MRSVLLFDSKNPAKINDLASALIPDSITQGRQLAHQALVIAEETKNFEEQAQACYTIGDSWWYEQDFATAITWFGKSAAYWEIVDNRLEAAACYNEMGYSSVEIDRFDDALKFYRKSLQLLLEIDDEENIAAVITNIARVYEGVAKYDSAIYFNQQAIALLEVPGKEEELSAALGNLGLVYKLMGDYERALEYYIKAFNTSKKTGVPGLLAVDLNNIAALYFAWDKYELAEDYFSRALAIHYETGNLAHAEMTLNNLAHVAQKQGEPDSALVLYKKSLSIAEDLGRHGNAAVRKQNIGTIYFDKGDYEQALAYLVSGTETVERLCLQQYAAGGFLNIGATYLAMGNFKEAGRNLDIALNISKQISALPVMQKIYKTQSELYEKTGRTKMALEAFRDFTLIKDSIFTEQSQARLAEMEVRYETEKKQQQIEILVKDSQLHEAELHKKQLTLIGLSGGLLILFIASGIISVLYIQKLKANRKLVEKNIELIRQDEEQAVKTDEAELSPQLKDEEKTRLLFGLEVMMKQEKAFTQPQLSLTDLADKLQTNTAYLSRIINEHFNMNLSNYINKFRVREAQKLFAENKHHSMTLEGIAGSVGFHSRSTFNAAFKKITGVTPSIYIKNQDQITKNYEMGKTLNSRELHE